MSDETRTQTATAERGSHADFSSQYNNIDLCHCLGRQPVNNQAAFRLRLALGLSATA